MFFQELVVDCQMNLNIYQAESDHTASPPNLIDSSLSESFKYLYPKKARYICVGCGVGDQT